MLKITSIAIGLLTIVSMATSAQAAPREIYSPSNGHPEVIVRDGSGHHGRHGGENRRGGHHAEREGGHHRQYRSTRNRSRVVYNSRRSESRGHHGRRHGVVRHHH
jgi:hypothetical protein